MSEKYISNRATLWLIGLLLIFVIILFFGVFNLDHRLTTFEQKAELVEWGVTDRIGNLELTGFSEGEWVCDKNETTYFYCLPKGASIKLLGAFLEPADCLVADVNEVEASGFDLNRVKISLTDFNIVFEQQFKSYCTSWAWKKVVK